MKISLPALNWPTAVVLSLSLAAIVGIFWLIEPGARLEAITSVAGVAIPLLAAMEKLFKGDPVVPAADALDDSRTPPRSEANGRLTGRLPSLKRGWFAGFLALSLGGCSPSALQVHATVASVTGEVFDTACHEVELARSREQHAVADGPLEYTEAKAEVDALRARWAPAIHSCQLAADGHAAWVSALALAAAGAPLTLASGITLANHILTLWDDLAATLAPHGVEMPAVPLELRALTGGVQ